MDMLWVQLVVCVRQLVFLLVSALFFFRRRLLASGQPRI